MDANDVGWVCRRDLCPAVDALRMITIYQRFSFRDGLVEWIERGVSGEDLTRDRHGPRAAQHDTARAVARVHRAARAE